MSERRLTPNYSTDPGPPPVRKARRTFRIAKMDLIGLIVAYGLACSYGLFADNLTHSLNPLHWTRARLHFGNALFQALWLSVVLLAFELVMRLNRKPKRAAP